MAIIKPSLVQFVAKPVRIMTELASSFGFVRECLCRRRALCKALHTGLSIHIPGIYKVRWNYIYFYPGRWSCPVSAQQHGSNCIRHMCIMGSHSPPIKLTDICYHMDNINSIKSLFKTPKAIIKHLTSYACNWCMQLSWRQPLFWLLQWLLLCPNDTKNLKKYTAIENNVSKMMFHYYQYSVQNQNKKC